MGQLVRKSLLHILNRHIRRSALLTRVLFGVKTRGGRRIHWDFTTLVLKRSLRTARPGMRVLEVGTGPYGLLAVHLARRGCHVTACDINSAYVAGARRTANRNRARAEFLRSDLFDRVTGAYDLILFNAVYIPRQTGRALGIAALHDFETDWCGGRDGAETIERFLREAPGHLRDGGCVLLGYNPHYLPTGRLVALCRALGLAWRLCPPVLLNPSRVLLIGRKERCDG